MTVYANQRDGSFGLCKEGVHIYLASGNQKNRPFGLYLFLQVN